MTSYTHRRVKGIDNHFATKVTVKLLCREFTKISVKERKYRLPVSRTSTEKRCHHCRTMQKVAYPLPGIKFDKVHLISLSVKKA